MRKWTERVFFIVGFALVVVAAWQAVPGAATATGQPLHLWIFALLGGLACLLSGLVFMVLRSQQERQAGTDPGKSRWNTLE